MKKVKILGKMIPVFVLVLLGIGMVSGALVLTWGQTKMNIVVTEAITIDNNVCDFSTIAGDSYELCLVSGSNNLNESVPTMVSFTLFERVSSEWVEVNDTTGFYIGFTEDSQYAYNPAYGNVSNWADAQTWMLANPDWLDWYLNTPIANFDSTLVINDGDDSVTVFDFVNTGPLSQDISALDEFYVAVYIGTDLALESGNYRLVVEFKPVV